MQPKAKIHRKVGEDRISELSDDLLEHILCLVPTKDAVTTMILSKRWRFVWTMMPKLDYSETLKKKSVWNFLDKSMQLHRAHSLESLCIRLFHDYPVNEDVENRVTYAVERCIRELHLRFPREQNLPACLYTCKTLVTLALYSNVLVDVPSLPSLPSLQSLTLTDVMYKNQDSHVKFLSSCPVLKHLNVIRSKPDNATSFIVKVPSLESLTYFVLGSSGLSLVIDSPSLRYFQIFSYGTLDCSIQNMPRLDEANLHVHVNSPHNEKFLTSFSSVMSLQFYLTEFDYCGAMKFSRLIELKLRLNYSETSWFERVMLLLHNAPRLKVLMIEFSCKNGLITHSWKQPSSVPECLLSHLEIFEWKPYLGGIEENKMMAYILANSKCLKTVGIHLPACPLGLEGIRKTTYELQSMYRASSSSQLLFSAQLKWRYRK